MGVEIKQKGLVPWHSKLNFHKDADPCPSCSAAGPAPCLWIGPILVVAAITGVNQWMGELSLHLSL